VSMDHTQTHVLGLCRSKPPLKSIPPLCLHQAPSLPITFRHISHGIIASSSLPSSQFLYHNHLFTSGIMPEAHGERHFRIAINLPPCPPPAPPSRSTHRESSTFSQSPKASPTTAK
jgi:hypothetical protein